MLYSPALRPRGTSDLRVRCFRVLRAVWSAIMRAGAVWLLTGRGVLEEGRSGFETELDAGVIDAEAVCPKPDGGYWSRATVQ
jgi:hypothetical protein